MIRFFSIFMLIFTITNNYAIVDSTMVLTPDLLQAQDLVLTPGYQNIVLAKINDKDIQEFDVFGISSFNKSRIKMSNSKRADKIQDYILNVIFQTEGNITEVLNSKGYRVTYKKLSKKVAVDLFREDLIKDKFSKDLSKVSSKEINGYIKNMLDSLKISYGVTYNNELLSSISKIKISDPFKYADSLFVIGAHKELITYKNQKVTVKDLAAVVKQIKPYYMKNLEEVSVIKSLIDGKVLNNLLVEVAGSKGYFEDKRVEERTIDQMKYLVSSEYKKRLFSQDNLKPSKDELIDYYIEHKDDSELKTIKKMWTSEIFKAYDNTDNIESNDKIKVALELENIRQKIIAGDSFEKYAKFYARPNSRNGELGYIYRTDHAMIGQTADSLKVNEISELIIQSKAISVIKVTEIKESQLYKFDYVEEIVKKRVINIKKDILKNELRRKLFKKYKVELLYAQ
ncbi:MAG: peptidylprolyl isomerase [Candidatus Delongbacteria bacterium]|jgi:hypothetical protein|nr:peptidylprolyl isomerase [Candidatus Delongbacteria bacterium]